MHDVYEEVQGLGAEVLVVTFSAPERIPDYVALHKWSFPVVSDPEFAAYRNFGLPKGTWWQVAGLGVIPRYIRLMFSGRTKFSTPPKGDDVLQLGGDFVIGADGTLKYIFRSKRSTDRPSVEQLMDVIRELAE